MQILLAAGAGLACAVLAVLVLRRLRRRFAVVRQLAFPLYLAVAAGAAWVFALLHPPAAVALGEALLWALVFVAAVALLRLAGLYLFEVYLKGRRGVHLPPLLAAVAVWAAYLLVALIVLRLAFPALSVAPLLATSAVTSLVLGLALQPILGNFFAGLVISVERPFRINDWVRVGDQEGRVVAITWRTTQLRTRENDNLIIPNGKIAEERVVNFNLPHKIHLERIEVGVDYRTPPYRVRRALLESAEGVEGVLDRPTPEVYLLGFGDHAVNYELRVWIEDYAHSPRVGSEVRSRIWETFRRHGITIPFPIRTLEVAPRRRGGRPAPGEAPPARLYVAEGSDRGRVLELDGSPATVGRSRACALVLADGRASKEHARVEFEGGAYRVTDLGSRFGTRVNGRPVEGRAPLADLDRISLGDSVIVFEADAP